jgi:eukaryotic-like serine/threonine-protein kinase
MRLHDRYELAEPIGSGGMAQVWRATDLVLGRSVAVKTLDARLALDPQLRAGARREAQAAAKLTHPHITAVHDYGELTFDDGRVVPFLVMELLTGQTLAQLMQNGPMPWEQVSAIAGQIASALAAAHTQGVVHQDIKPANVMLTPTGAKILDFGIVRAAGKAQASHARAERRRLQPRRARLRDVHRKAAVADRNLGAGRLGGAHPARAAAEIGAR